nr:DUF3311 domain-containing protein [Pseudonocardia sp. H11422]
MPRTSSSDGRRERPGLRRNRRNRWNLLLVAPFVMLVTPLFNSIEPRLFGVPFFYWSQFAWVPVGVLCVAIVHRKTVAR